jgi:hypothetical protein
MQPLAEMTQDSVLGQADFLRAGGYTRRYHGWRTIKDDLVGQHSYNVANLLVLLFPDCSKEALVAAIRHDTAEWIVGDRLAPRSGGCRASRHPWTPTSLRSGCSRAWPIPWQTSPAWKSGS